MREFSADIARMGDCEAVLSYVRDVCRDEGVTWFSYHFTPVFEPHTVKQAFVWARDLPLEYQKLYIGDDFRAMDPVPRLTFEFGPILTWSRARELVGPVGEGADYFAKLAEIGADNWATFALFGPRSRDGYATTRFAEDPDSFREGRLQAVQSLLQAGHLQICKILEEAEPGVVLSDREKEVLEWVGRGKSSSEIATILSISSETVRTYTRRIYEKLESNDRVTATVRALKLGIIEL